MKESIHDRIVGFIAARGTGVSSAELAREFLAPASAPEALCDKLIVNILENEARVMQTPEGLWAPTSKHTGATPGGEFTVVETVDIAAGGGRLPVEWAALRVDAQGRIGEGREGIICPRRWLNDALAPPHLTGKIRAGASSREALSAAAELTHGTTLVSIRPGPFQEHLLKMLRLDAEDARQLFLGRLARQVVSHEIKSIQDLAARVEVPVREPETAAERAAFVAKLLSAMLHLKENLNLPEPDEWLEHQRPKRIDIDFSRYDFDRDFLDNLPRTPGVYIMRNANGSAIYVGKAVNLQRRVGDYFRARVRTDEKTARIQEAVYAIDVEDSGSELAALLLEHQLIQKLQPPVNRQYDVHERHANQRAPSRRWIAILRAVAPQEVEIFMFYGNRTMRRLLVRREEPEQLREALAEFFFSSHPPKPEAETELGWLRIAWSWLERNRDAANIFDVELTGGPAEVLRVLRNYISEAPGEGKVFHV